MPNNTPTTRVGGSEKRLNEQERLDIIRKLRRPNPPSKRSIAREYNVSEGAIRYIWTKRDEIEQRSGSMTPEARGTIYRQSNGHFPQVESQLFTWIEAMRMANLPVAPSLALAKAKKIALNLGISDDDFKGSWQWFQKFRGRHGLQQSFLHGEGGEVDREDPEMLAQLNDLYDVINQYDPEHVYNMDETGYFYRQLPKYSLLLPNEDISSVRGKKKLKDRISLVVCANSTGSHKISCTVIGKSKQPACIKNRNWPLPYFSQNKAWMDKSVCWTWFREVFTPEVRQRTGRRVLLILDNAPGHFDEFEEDNIRVVFFPPNCTSWKQPCDQGIIAALKKRVKYLYLKDVFEYFELDEAQKQHKRTQAQMLPRGAAGTAYGNPAHILDAANYVKKAWDDITNDTIANAWRKAEIITRLGQRDAEFDEVAGDNQVDAVEDNHILDVEDNQINIENNEIAAADVLFNDILHDMAYLNITQQDMDAFLNCDNENSPDYIEAIMEEVNDLLQSEEAHDNVNIAEEYEHDKESEQTSVTSPRNENEQVHFIGLDDIYEKMLAIEDQLISKEFESTVGEDYDSILSSFSCFQSHLRGAFNKVKRKEVTRRRQLTLHDAFSREIV